MNKLNLAPTKSNQLALRREVAFAQEGFHLLEQKREILISELMKLLAEIKALGHRLEQAQKLANAALKLAIASNGRQRLKSAACAVEVRGGVEIATVVKAGVRVPVLRVSKVEPARRYGPVGSDSLVDAAIVRLGEVFEITADVVRLENEAWVLARELKKTQRRVNALEQIFIPDIQSTLKFIGESLESKELESFGVMKMIKKRIHESRRH